MPLFELNNVGRYYLVDKNRKYVLENISLSFPHRGFISILGKSGCGKSTLLNMIGAIDYPSEGTVYFNNEDISKYKEKKMAEFHSKMVSFIFQHYHLLEDESALYNVMLPSLISGDKYKTAEKKALELFDTFSINKEIIYKKCKNLSGGEKERVAILRSLINKPKAILADEPTGALDKANATLVMETLKKYSKKCLVILVTHNNELANLFSDRIIYMQDGKAIKDERINATYDQANKTKPKKQKAKSGWSNRIIFTNFRKRFKRNLFSIASLTIGLVSSLLIFGFNNGKNSSINKSLEKQYDYGSLTINKEKRIKNDNSPITLIQTMRPNQEEIIELNYRLDDYHVCYSYDALVSPIPEISLNEKVIDDLTYTPVYSFIDESTNHNLLIKGEISSFDTLNKVLVNKKAYDLLNRTLKFNCLNSYLRIEDKHQYSFNTNDHNNPSITDYFVYDRLVQIVGVVDEITFLNTPKIYYSYAALDKYLSEVLLNNLSEYQGEITWKQRVIDSLDNDPLSSYACRLFLKDINNLKKIKTTSVDGYVINSNALTIEETLFSLVDAASVGMEVFLGIALVGVTMIIGIISFASYSESIKESAIMLCLGAKRDDVALIYVIESMILGLISVFLSFALATVLTKPINLLIQKFTSLIDIISIPLLRFQGRVFPLPLLIVFITLLICLFATYVPIGFGKRISLKEELKAND